MLTWKNDWFFVEIYTEIMLGIVFSFLLKRQQDTLRLDDAGRICYIAGHL